MKFHPKRSVSAILSAVMLLGVASPPAQALDSRVVSAEKADPRLCSHHEAHTEECGGLTGDCTFVCPEHTPQILPELDDDVVDGTPTEQPEVPTQPETPDASEQTETPVQPDGSEQTDPSVPTEPAAPSETIPAMTLTPAQPIEDTQADSLEVLPEAMPPMMLTARASDIVYTSVTGGNQSHTGDGSYANPYNLFDDAVKNTMPGGTIIIKNKAFLNTQDEYGSKPYIIDKPLTITSEYADSPAMLQVRTGGIVLGGDVTFENVNLGFENRVHDAIFANGHTLKLINVSRSNGSREVDLFGGQLYDATTNRPYAENKKGSNSQIIIEMKDPKLASLSSLHFGNIYAGSMNGSFDEHVTIKVTDSNKGKTKFIGDIYSSGADEANPGSMLDIKEPNPPAANTNYATSGTVTMNFDSLPLRGSVSDPMLIDGTTGNNSSKTNLSVSVDSPTGNLKLNNIANLTVKKETIQPTEDSTATFDSIKIESGAGLDLSKISSTTTEELSGDGTLTLKKDGELTVSNAFTGHLTFQTEGSWNDKSGIVNEQTYITVPTNSSGSFIFTPHQSQNGWTFTNTIDPTKWTIKKPDGATNPSLMTTLEIQKSEEYKTIYQNDSLVFPPEFPLNLQFESGTIDDNIQNTTGLFELSVLKEQSENPVKLEFDGDVYTSLEIPFALSIYGVEDDTQAIVGAVLIVDRIQISDDSYKPIDLGLYEIDISYPGVDGKMLTAKAYLESIQNPPEPPPTDPDGSNSEISITPSKKSAAFGESITIDATITKSSMFSTRMIEENNAYLYVNGQLVGQDNLTNPIVNVTTESIQFAGIDVTPTNGFRAGNNQISVVYGGGDKIASLGKLAGSTGTTTITVTKEIAPQVEVKNLSPQTFTYDGTAITYRPQAIVQVGSIRDEKPNTNVTYTKNSISSIQAPTLPGEYTTKVEVSEGLFYQKASVNGPTITIQKATPKVSISHTFTENDKLILQATVQGPDKGIIPTGKVTFTVGSTIKEIPLNYGIATVEIERPQVGNHTIQAAYTPSNGSEDIYDSPQKPTETTIKIESDHKALTGITLNKQTLVLKQGNSADLKVAFQPYDASNQNLTWTSTDQTVATVENGKVTAKSAGTTTIQALAEEGGHVAFCTVMVSEKDIPVQSVEINVPNKILKVGETSQLSAIITPHNATTRDVKWESKSTAITVDSSTGMITANNVGSAEITAIVGGKQATCTITVSDNIPVTDIKLDNETLSLKAKQTVLLTANITPDNATNANVTWKSSSPNFVDVDATTGWVTAKQKTNSPVTITATTTDGSNREATCKITVTEATGAEIPVERITITPGNLTLNVNERETLRASVSPDDATNQKVIWESKHKDIATVNENTGEVTGVAAGTATIIATSVADPKKTASIIVTVEGKDPTPPPKPEPTEPKIEIAPASLSLEVGGTGKFTAKVTNGDANQVTWSIVKGSDLITLDPLNNSDTTQVTVKGNQTGDATVQATYTKSGKSVHATATVEVKAKPTPDNPTISIDPKQLKLQVDQVGNFTAQVQNATPDTTVQWKILDGTDGTNIIKITPQNQSVTVTALSKGTATVQASLSNHPDVISTATVEVTEKPAPIKPTISITPPEMTITVGESKAFTASISPNDATDAIIWSVEAGSEFVSIDSSTGTVTPIKPGTATIKATSSKHSDVSMTAKVTITKPVIPVTDVKINEDSLSLKPGEKHKFTATVSPKDADQNVTWTSDKPTIVSIDSRTGEITALKPGQATITAASVTTPDKKDSKTVTVVEVPITSLKINESILSLQEGQSAQLTVKITPENATNSSVKWESDNTAVLSVTQDGYITAHNKGVATITVISVAQSEMKDSRMISVTASSSGGGGGSSGGGSSGGGSSSHKPSKPDKKPAKPEPKPETKPETPAVIPPSVKPQQPVPGVPVITTAPPVNPTINTDFTDVPQTHWASEPIQDVVSRGLFVGTEPNEFSPNESMSRAMVVTVLHRLAGEPAVQAVNQFTDVGRTYYTDAVTWASQNHIVSGTSANTFTPNLMVTREELVVMLYRLANPVPDTSSKLTGFSDTAKVSSWAAAPMQWAVKNEILKGSDSALLPQKKLTRAEAASLIYRFTEKILHI